MLTHWSYVFPVPTHPNVLFIPAQVHRHPCVPYQFHYNDVIMGTMASEITSLIIVYSTVYSGADQRKHQSSASLVFVRGIHLGPVNSPHKWPVTRKMFPFDDVIMVLLWWVTSGSFNFSQPIQWWMLRTRQAIFMVSHNDILIEHDDLIPAMMMFKTITASMNCHSTKGTSYWSPKVWQGKVFKSISCSSKPMFADKRTFLNENISTHGIAAVE